MNKYFLFTYFLNPLLLLLLYPFSSVHSENKQLQVNDSYILILSSYDPDNYRFANFTKEMEQYFYESGHNQRILTENLSFGSINDIHNWKSSMQNRLRKYDKENVKGILLLGQEAWCGYVNQDSLYRSLPFYVCFASENVLKLPCHSTDQNLISENGKEICLDSGLGSGNLNSYDIEANIRLVKLLYPHIDNIALLSDNSYGGIALQSLVKKEISEKFPELSLTLLDSRFATVSEIKNKIQNLTQRTALLIGTWRINQFGLYFSRHTLREIVPKSCVAPVFSLTGLGIGDIAIGGYVPDYKIDSRAISSHLIKTYYGQNKATNLTNTRNQYRFDRRMLKKYGIREYQLPSESIIEDGLESMVKKYQGYVFFTLIALILLCLIIGRCIISERRLKQKQKELITALTRAEQSEKLKSAFLANMSHEIRTPLNAIIGFSELLINSENQNEKNQFGNLIVQNNDLLLNLVNDLLDLSKIEAGYIDFHIEVLNLNELFENIFNDFQYRLSKNIDMELQIPDYCIILEADRKRITQIISNYLSNAIKFTESGKIIVGYNSKDDGIFCFVKDTGIGISKKDYHKVFERFEKFDSFAQGTGLGLSICKAIAEACGGKVGFSSEVGLGSTFWCWLPINPVSLQKNNLSRYREMI